MGERISFAGAVANTELPALLRAHSFYASAVPTDGVSASLLEAMACGCFPIVVDNDANRDWVTDGETGRLLTDPSPEAFAAALAAAWQDSSSRERARRTNLAVVRERANLDTNMRTIEERYAALVAMAQRN